MPTISGVTKDASNAPCEALVRVYRRDTGAFVGQAVSDATTGAYSVTTEDTTAHVVMRFVAPVVQVAGDSDWASVSLLLHMDGSNGSTVFTDETGKAVTAHGNAQISTAIYRFGGASALFDGTGDYLSVPHSADFAYASGDFTIECWVYPTSTPSTYGSIVAKRAALANYASMLLAITSSNKLAVFAASSSTTWGWYDQTTVTLTLNTWQHIAVSRQGGVLRVFKDGVLSITGSAGFSMYDDGDSALTIGEGAVAGGQPFSGNVDELRITKGVARYTTDFTPPSSAFLAATLDSLGAPTENAQIFDNVIPV